MSVIREIRKIHKQHTIPATVLMAIRAKIEFNAGIPNRIGSMFENGNRGVLIVGRSGTSKTTALKSIYNGLHSANFVWFSSAGASSGVGMYEILTDHRDSVIFVDEMSLDTSAHIQVMKQISNGEIMRPKHGDREPIPFTGVVVGATNGIKAPSANDMEHLLATLDRFYVIKAESPNLTPGQYLSSVLSYKKSKEEPDWHIICNALLNNNYNCLSSAEESVLENLWNEKCKEILDPTRAQYRNAWTAHDIFLFVKRFLNTDVSEDVEAVQLATSMIDDLIHFNPMDFMSLQPLQEVIYEMLRDGDEVRLQEIESKCHELGMTVTKRHLNRVLNNMINSRMVYKSKHGHYSVKKNPVVVKDSMIKI